MDRRSARLLCVLLAAACGNGDDGGGGTAPAPDEGSASGDVGAELPGKSDAANDGAGGEVGDGPPPWFGIACEASTDCPSGWCVQGQCTDVCIDSCPNGWICKSLTGTGSDVTFVCVPDGNVLCSPCATDADCTAGGLHCVQLGSEGTFCAIQCDASAVGCPVGYACTEKGGAAFCLPQSGNCACTQDNLGEVQACAAVGEGLCPGLKTCTKKGWTGCSAQELLPEACNGKDDDCDGLIDEEGAAGCTNRWIDADDDAWGAGAPRCLCATGDGYEAPAGGDCDDGNVAVHPGLAELCNGQDDDCDGATDEDTGGKVCQVPGDASSCPGETLCTGGQLTCVGKAPAPETCNGIDDDCDGTADEGTGGGECVNESAFGACPGTYLCAGQAGLICSAKSPAAEACNGADDDCDGAVDPEGAVGCTSYFADADGDGFGVEQDAKCLCKPGAPYTASQGGDCDDTEKAVHAGAAEVCNGADDDCNGAVDTAGQEPGGTPPGPGGDAGAWGDVDGKLCTPEGGGTCPGVTVCADGVLSCVGKAPAPETCNGIDDDCDGVADDGTSGGACDVTNAFGACTGTLLCAGAQGPLCSAKTPAAETCNGADDDCDGELDPPGAEGCLLFYADQDGDGFGVTSDGKCLCKPGAPYVVTMGGDCDDAKKDVHPGAAELCNGADDDCNDAVDDGADGKVCIPPGGGTCPGVTVCANGVLACQGQPAKAEVCNGIDDDCDGVADDGTAGVACEDANAFGTCTGVSACNGADGLSCSAKTPAAESCNGADDDCDGLVDPAGTDGCTVYYADADGDGFGAAGDSACLCKPGAPYTALAPGDCDDASKAVHPGAAEACNAVDDDCSGEVDDGTGGKLCQVPGGSGACPGVTVCADGAVTCTGKAPSAEVCNGIDDDCNGLADDGTAGGQCVAANAFGACFGVQVCNGEKGLSCTAKEPTSETCNGADDDCDLVADPPGTLGCVTYYADEDGDGFGVTNDAKCLCKPAAPWTASLDGDCDDTRKAVHPGAAETCNALDDDCSGEVDDGTDGKLCAVAGGGTSCPGVTVCAGGVLSCTGKAPAAETCNGIDDDCNGVADDGTSGGACVVQNAFGSCAGLQACNGAAGLVCSAKTPAAESCNGMDDDCDGAIDPVGASGCTDYAKDQDGDGYGLATDVKCLCKPTAPYTAGLVGDCDDGKKAIHPGAAETCNGIDESCDGQVDEGTDGKLCQVSGGSGACPGVTVCKSGALTCSGKAPSAEVCNGIDDDCNGVADNGTSGGACSIQNAAGACFGTYACNGAAGLVCSAKTPAAESCNGLDDDCNGAIDPAGATGCLTFHADADGDGFGSDSATACLCKATTAFPTLTGGDCNDAQKAVHPGVAEACNGVDDDCNGAIDGEGSSGCTSYFADADGDGFGAVGLTKCLCAPSAPYKVTVAGDCNDADGAVKPGGVEICDGKDQSCEGVIDEGCDKDGDGWCVLGATVVGTPSACKNGTGDCNDANAGVHPTLAELCNFVDENCNGQIDEGVASPCGTCNSFCQWGNGPGTGTDWSSDPNDFNGTKPDANGYLVLDSQTTNFRTLWVANSAESTVSKIDTPTGKELARYAVCADPSRTSVATDGSVWIACRGDGKVAHIALDTVSCVDKNANGKIETSSDTNGDGKISGAELLASGKDECVILTALPDGGSNLARALGIDKNGNPWVGFWNTKHVRKIDPVTGASVALVDLSSVAGSPYGLALDKVGTVWVATRDSGRLVAIDTSKPTLPFTTYSPPSSLNTYGIAVDMNGHVWLGTGEGKKVLHFNPTTAKFTTISTDSAFGYTRGVAASADGFVYVAHYTWDDGCSKASTSRRVSKIDVATDTVVGNIDLGGIRGPVGVAIDFDGFVWAINQCTWTASKIDPKTMSVVGEYPTGATPYTYSDMTGYALKTVVAPSGSYLQTFEGWSSGNTKWLVVSPTVATPGASTLEIRYRTAATKPGLAAVAWSAWAGPFPPAALPWAFPNDATALGRFVQLELMLKSNGSTTTPQLKSLQVMAAQVP